jgi:hypothetical protein
MNRLVLLVACLVACSKSAGNQDKVSSPPTPGSPETIAVPQGGPGPQGPMMGKTAEVPPEPGKVRSPGTVDDDRFRLKPDEGTLAVVAPTDVKAGTEAVARITVTPAKGYKVNTEYPIQLKLASVDGVTLAKDKFAAGGHDKAKGDADALDEKGLELSVKLTPAASGNYTINGKFKFAVCDHDQCLAKQETIAIAVAAK